MGKCSRELTGVFIVTQLNYDATTEKLLSSVLDFGVGRLNLTTSFGYDTVVMSLA